MIFFVSKNCKFKESKDRNFDIYNNNTLLKTVSLDGSGGDKFYDVDYAIPDNIIKSLQHTALTIKFTAHPGSMAGGIYYVRLLK